MTMGNQLHAKKLSAMRQAYTEEIKELQEWTGALEDTLTSLVKYCQFPGGDESSVDSLKLHLMSAWPQSVDAGIADSSSDPWPNAMPYAQRLSSPNMKVLAQIVHRARAKDEASNTNISTIMFKSLGQTLPIPENQNSKLGGACPECRVQEDVRIRELERELQDLTENFVQQMYVLKEENNQLKQALGNAKDRPIDAAAQSKLQQADVCGSKCSSDVECEHLVKCEKLITQIGMLKMQLEEREEEFRKSNDNARELRSALEHERIQHRQHDVAIVSRIDAEVEEAQWLLNELSLDRARHSLERSRTSVYAKKLDDLNNMVHKPAILIPGQATSAPVPPVCFDSSPLTRSHKPIDTAAGAASTDQSILTGPVGTRQNMINCYTAFGNAALERIPEGVEEASPTNSVSRSCMTNSSMASSHDRFDDDNYDLTEPEEPTFAPFISTPISSGSHCSVPEKPLRSSNYGDQNNSIEVSRENMTVIQDSLPMIQGVEAPPSTPIGEQLMPTAFLSPSIQPAARTVTVDWEASDLFQTDSEPASDEQYASDVPVVKVFSGLGVPQPQHIIGLDSTNQLEVPGENGRKIQYLISEQDRIQQKRIDTDLMPALPGQSKKAEEPAEAVFLPIEKEFFDASMRPVRKDDTSKGPHHHLPKTLVDPCSVREGLVINTRIEGSGVKEALSVRVDKPPLRPPPFSPTQLAKIRSARGESASNANQMSGMVKPAPPGGKPRKTRSSFPDFVLAEHNVPSAGSLNKKSIPPAQKGERGRGACERSVNKHHVVQSNARGVLDVKVSSGGSSKEGKLSFKRIVSGFISSVRSISPSGMRSSPKDCRNPSPTTRHASPSAQSWCDSVQDHKERSRTVKSSSAPSSPCDRSKNRSSRNDLCHNASRQQQRISEDQQDDEHMQRFLKHSLQAARSMQKTSEAFAFNSPLLPNTKTFSGSNHSTDLSEAVGVQKMSTAHPIIAPYIDAAVSTSGSFHPYASRSSDDQKSNQHSRTDGRSISPSIRSFTIPSDRQL